MGLQFPSEGTPAQTWSPPHDHEQEGRGLSLATLLPLAILKNGPAKATQLNTNMYVGSPQCVSRPTTWRSATAGPHTHTHTRARTLHYNVHTPHTLHTHTHTTYIHTYTHYIHTHTLHTYIHTHMHTHTTYTHTHYRYHILLVVLSLCHRENPQEEEKRKFKTVQ